jgi:hypothetical protein
MCSGQLSLNQRVHDPYCNSSATVMNLVSEPFHRFASCISSPTNIMMERFHCGVDRSQAPIWTRKTEAWCLGLVYDDVRRSSYKIESFCGHSCRKTGADAIVIRSTNAIIYYCAALCMVWIACLQSDEAFSRISCFIDELYTRHMARPPDDFTSFTIFMTTVVLPEP